MGPRAPCADSREVRHSTAVIQSLSIPVAHKPVRKEGGIESLRSNHIEAPRVQSIGQREFTLSEKPSVMLREAIPEDAGDYGGCSTTAPHQPST